MAKNYDAKTCILRRDAGQPDVPQFHEQRWPYLSPPGDAPDADQASNPRNRARAAARKPAPRVFVASPGGRRD